MTAKVRSARSNTALAKACVVSSARRGLAHLVAGAAAIGGAIPSAHAEPSEDPCAGAHSVLTTARDELEAGEYEKLGRIEPKFDDVSVAIRKPLDIRTYVGARGRPDAALLDPYLCYIDSRDLPRLNGFRNSLYTTVREEAKARAAEEIFERLPARVPLDESRTSEDGGPSVSSVALHVSAAAAFVGLTHFTRNMEGGRALNTVGGVAAGATLGFRLVVAGAESSQGVPGLEYIVFGLPAAGLGGLVGGLGADVISRRNPGHARTVLSTGIAGIYLGSVLTF